MENEEKIEQPKTEAAPQESKPKKFNMKIVLFGLPLFIVQLIIVYFVTANLLLSKIVHNENISKAGVVKDSAGSAKGGSAPAAEFGKYIFQIEDVIVNPADTEGKRLVLTSVGFDVPDDKQMQEFKSKEVILKDVIVTTLSSKTLAQLSSATFKDSIKTELVARVRSEVPGSKLNTVYLSKYIIQ